MSEVVAGKVLGPVRWLPRLRLPLGEVAEDVGMPLQLRTGGHSYDQDICSILLPFLQDILRVL